MEQNIYNAIYKVNHAGGCGSCFYLKQYDLFVTNYHVVEGFRQVAIQDNDKNSFLARVVMVNSVLDICCRWKGIFLLFRISGYRS